MAKAVKKASARKPAAKAKRATPRRKKTTRSSKSPTTLQRLEGAILATVAEVDELAVEMGLAGSVPPKKKRKKVKR